MVRGSRRLELRSRALSLLGGALLGLLACKPPSAEPVAPDTVTTAPGVSAAASSGAAGRPREHAALDGSSVASGAPSASAPPAPVASASVSPEVPDEGKAAIEQMRAAHAAEVEATKKARGRCSGWDSLSTKQGEVRCYPFRCRVDRCLTRCEKRADCAGSLGPGDMAEHGWPLDCGGSGSCYPLPPSHVHGHGH